MVSCKNHSDPPEETHFHLSLNKLFCTLNKLILHSHKMTGINLMGLSFANVDYAFLQLPGDASLVASGEALPPHWL